MYLHNHGADITFWITHRIQALYRHPLTMNSCQTLAFQDLALQEVERATPSDFLCMKGQHKAWGALESNTLQNKFFGIHEFKADFNDRLRVRFDDASMLTSMNICVVLDGHVSLDLRDSKFSASLSALKHHFVYSHETEYDLIIDKSVRVIHITIDKEYYAGLLQACEPWAFMKDSLHDNRQVCSGSGNVSLAMNRALQDLMCNPLQGHLRELFTEAKVLELVALQLASLSDVRNQPAAQKDKDVFHELRCYLDTHFNDDLSLRLLSRAFGLNEFKLKKGFKTFFNTTIFDYIHEQKMLHASKLLLDDHMLVNEVAGKVGYKNPNHFSTAFKRRFGIVPTALR
jgi:AraC family transcriptional regulator, transcriptional activator of the genes for pyochelin and ferripyochelin receptors